MTSLKLNWLASAAVPMLLAACATAPQPTLPAVQPLQLPPPPAEVMMSLPPQSFVTRTETILSRLPAKPTPSPSASAPASASSKR